MKSIIAAALFAATIYGGSASAEDPRIAVHQRVNALVHKHNIPAKAENVQGGKTVEVFYMRDGERMFLSIDGKLTPHFFEVEKDPGIVNPTKKEVVAVYDDGNLKKVMVTDITKENELLEFEYSHENNVCELKITKRVAEQESPWSIHLKDAGCDNTLEAAALSGKSIIPVPSSISRLYAKVVEKYKLLEKAKDRVNTDNKKLEDKLREILEGI